MSEEIKFEKALEKLEKIVEDLESGQVDLDEALKKYEEGVKLSRICQQRLSQAEKKIQVLTRALDGSLKKEPFDLEDTEGGPPAKEQGGKKTAVKKNGGDEDLLI